MRHEKLTTKFQEALADAQSLALANDHAYIEPAHLLVAMLKQHDGPKALLQRAGVNLGGLLTAAETAVKKLPQVTGQDQVQGGPDLGKLLQATEKEALKRGDAVCRQRAFFAGAWPITRRHLGDTARANGFTRKSLEAAIETVRGGQGV
jgi:ATP-dependent Clp protease ATP-binding subunit ClpB